MRAFARTCNKASSQRSAGSRAAACFTQAAGLRTLATLHDAAGPCTGVWGLTFQRALFSTSTAVYRISSSGGRGGLPSALEVSLDDREDGRVSNGRAGTPRSSFDEPRRASDSSRSTWDGRDKSYRGGSGGGRGYADGRSGGSSSRGYGDSGKRGWEPRRPAPSFDDFADDASYSSSRSTRSSSSFSDGAPLPALRLFQERGREYLYGVHPCAAALATKSRPVYKAYVSIAAEEGSDAAIIATTASDAGTPVIRVDKQTLHNMVSTSSPTPHQGIIFETAPLELSEAPLELMPSAVIELRRGLMSGSVAAAPGDASDATPPPLLLATDELHDVQNVGALMRSALLLGADGIVLSRSNSAPLTPTVSKTSAGALEWWHASGRLWGARSLVDFLTIAKDSGAWRVMGTALPPAAASEGPGSASSSRSSEVAWVPSHALRRDVPTILVLGNEGRGMRPAVSRCCNAFTWIPMAAHGRGAGAFGGVDSLNVAAAAGVLLHQLAPAGGASSK